MRQLLHARSRVVCADVRQLLHARTARRRRRRMCSFFIWLCGCGCWCWCGLQQVLLLEFFEFEFLSDRFLLLSRVPVSASVSVWLSHSCVRLPSLSLPFLLRLEVERLRQASCQLALVSSARLESSQQVRELCAVCLAGAGDRPSCAAVAGRRAARVHVPVRLALHMARARTRKFIANAC